MLNNTQIEAPTWNLTSIFSNFESEDYKKAINEYIAGMDEIDSLLKYVKKFHSDSEFANWLANYITLSNKVGALEESLNAFAYSSYSTDTTNPVFLNNLSKLEELSLRTNAQSLSFQQILSENQQALSTFFTSFPQFEEYKYILQEELNDSRHRMSPPEEQLAEDLKRTGAAAWGRLHEQIISNLADKKTGKTFNEIRNLAYSPDAKIRRDSWQTEINLLKSMEIPIAAALNNLKGSTVILNKRRFWNEALDRALASSRMKMKTLEALITAIEESLPMWRKYLKLKAKILRTQNATAAPSKTEGLAFYDLFAPLPKAPQQDSYSTIKMEGWTFEEAQKYVIERFSSFSKDMGIFAEKAFQEKWIDAKVRKGKVGGAYCIDFPAHKVSRVLSNFTGTFSDVTTLAHELGHAYHHNCIVDKDYALSHYPMTLAETASIFAETIVMKDIISKTEGFDKACLVELHLQDSCQVLVDILCRFYFERSVFEKRKNAELSAEDFCHLMTKAQEKSYGSGLSEEKHPYMWAVKTHYYSPDLDFYNFPYAFGQLFAQGLYARYKEEGGSFAQTYKQLLANTGCQSCEDLCHQAGFDIESKNFWAEGIKLFAEELIHLEEYAAAL